MVLLFAALLTCIIMGNLFGQLINSKPTAVRDTCKGKIINVLSNDTDPNNDPLTATKFNGVLIPNTGLAVYKPDTGLFILEKNGQLTCKLDSLFYGNVYLTYFVSDSKSSSAARQTGSIVVIRSKPTGEIKSYFGYILRNNDSCKYSKKMVNWIEVVYDIDTVPGYIWRSKAYNYIRDSIGNKLPVLEQAGWNYMLKYRTKSGNETFWLLDQEDFIYISNNACKE